MASACATPVGVTREDPKVLYRAFSKSVLSADSASAFTEQLLRRRGLDEAFEKDPEGVLAELHRMRTSRDNERLFALAELSFVHGRAHNKREYVLASAIYAYAFLASTERRAELMPAADPRVRWAVDIYNVAMTFALLESPPPPANGAEPPPSTNFAQPPPANGAPPPPTEVLLTGRTLALPFGQVELESPRE